MRDIEIDEINMISFMFQFVNQFYNTAGTAANFGKQHIHTVILQNTGLLHSRADKDERANNPMPSYMLLRRLRALFCSLTNLSFTLSECLRPRLRRS